MEQFTLFVQSITQWIHEAFNGMEFLAAAIISVIAYKAPAFINKIYEFLVRRYTTTFMVDNMMGFGIHGIYAKVAQAVYHDGDMKSIRTLTAVTDYRGTGIKFHLAFGYGVSIITIFGTPVLARHEEIESSGSSEVKKRIVLRKLGRSHDVFEKMVDSFSEKDDDTRIPIYRYHATNSELERTSTIRKMSLDSVALNRDVKDKIEQTFGNFMDKEEEYTRRGLPHKLTAIFTGPPGTGKTSAIRAIASQYSLSILTININEASDGLLEGALRNARPGTIVLIEDFDSLGSLHKRGINTGDKRDYVPRPDNTKSDESNLADMMGVSLSGFLNALDGVVPLDGVIVALTTNRPEIIDEAVYRDGRVDVEIELPDVCGEAVKGHLEHTYPKLKDYPHFNYPTLRGCKIHKIKLAAGTDDDKMVAFISNLQPYVNDTSLDGYDINDAIDVVVGTEQNIGKRYGDVPVNNVEPLGDLPFTPYEGEKKQA